VYKRQPPRSTPLWSSAASDVYKRQGEGMGDFWDSIGNVIDENT
jgi:hypothetical protein